MDDLISRQAAIDAISCNITVTGRQNAELVAATIGTFADRIKALPPAQSEMRCEDCDSAELAGKGIYCLTHSVYMRCGDYCSYWQKEDAERREDD